MAFGCGRDCYARGYHRVLPIEPLRAFRERTRCGGVASRGSTGRPAAVAFAWAIPPELDPRDIVMTNLIHSIHSDPRPGMSMQGLERRAPAVFAGHRFEKTSPNYVFISTRDLVDALMQAGFAPTEAQQRLSRGSRFGYAKHMIRFRHESESVRIVDCMPEVILINAHDSSSSFQLRGGLYRFVCCNGLIVSLAEFGVIRIPHRGNVLANVVDGAAQITKQFAGIGQTIERMARTELAEEERMAFARRALELRYRSQERFPFDARELLAPRRAEDLGHNLWTVYNKVQENIMQGGITGRSATGRKTQSRKIGAIPECVRLNVELWQHAMSMIRA